MTPNLRYLILNRNLTFLMILGLIFTSCKKQEEYPIEPVIEYKSFEKIDDGSAVDNKAYLTISFTDGDGDIGLNDGDTLYPYLPNGPYYYNFLINYFEKQGDTFALVELPSTFNSRIPYVEKLYKNRGIKGEIRIELFFNNLMSTADSIMFSAQIMDRALHLSNVVYTPSIYVKKNK